MLFGKKEGREYLPNLPLRKDPFISPNHLEESDNAIENDAVLPQLPTLPELPSEEEEEEFHSQPLHKDERNRSFLPKLPFQGEHLEGESLNEDLDEDSRPSEGDQGELPQFPDSPLEEKKESSNSLPQFPDSPINNKFSQAAIKDAVTEETEDSSQSEEGPEEEDNLGHVTGRLGMETVEKTNGGPELEDEPQEDFGQPAKQGKPSFIEEEAKESLSKDFPIEDSSREDGRRKRKVDVYVKIDKFKDARTALESIKEKLGSIDFLIKRIREIKNKEDQELASWEKDVLHATSIISEIRENIFERVD